MSKFTTPLDLRAHGVKDWEVLTEFEYYRENNANEILIVPKGFRTDLATIPRIFWAILPPHDIYAKAAVLHDYLYENAINTKEYADEVFKEALRVLKVPKWKIVIMVAFVRWFGKGNYHKSKDPYLQVEKAKEVKPSIFAFFRFLRSKVLKKK